MNFRQVHLDFHTSEKIEDIGARFDKKQFQEALKTGHVNSITVFSKCHHGYAYHPTKANVMHPGLNFDLLKEQIEAAHEIGVKTPVYISAGFDERNAVIHSDWLVRLENDEARWTGFLTPGYHRMCLNSPYLDCLLSQIKEVCENYDADGIFLDIVGIIPCYCQHCRKALYDMGKSPTDINAVKEISERVYKNYLKRVRETVDSVKPGLPVFHNGGHIRQGRRDLAYANSHLEIESLPTGGWGYDHFPFSVAYAQNLGMEYLGMTGKFHTTWGEFGGFKHPNALRYEAALSIANGAKCSIGDQLLPNGHMDMTTYELIGEAYKEVEEKEKWASDVTPVCDVAIYSVESSQNEGGAADAGNQLKKSDIGVGRMMLEGKYLFTVIDSEVDFNKFKVIILPDSIKLNDVVYKKLKDFVKYGGKILATGNSGIIDDKFIFDFGAEYVEPSEYNPTYARPSWNNDDSSDYIMYSECNVIKVTNGKEYASVVKPYFNRTVEHFCSHCHTPSSGEKYCAGMVEGKDGIYIAWQIFDDYATKGELIAKNIVFYALDLLLENKKSLITDLGSMGVVTLMEQKDKNRYVANLLYAIPTKRGENIEVIEDIYPVYDVKLSVKKEAKNVYLAPQLKKIDFQIKDGYTTVNVDKIDCHQMVVFDY